MAAPFTVLDAIAACGVDNAILFNGNTAAQRVATDIFDDDFETCMDKDLKELDEDLKSYSQLTLAQGQIRLQPGIKKRIRAFIQWSRDMIRVGDDPTTIAFPVGETAELIKRMKDHAAYVKNSSSISETAKPTAFTDKIKWTDWEPVFHNFLRALPRRNGVPLAYVIRESDTPSVVDGAPMLENYITGAPHDGEAFVIDSANVHTYIMNFIQGNANAEAKILGVLDQRDGRAAYKRLKDHYEGVGINAIAITEAESVIQHLTYTGEKKPHMWWEEFEKKLTMAFTVHDRRENREVYSNEMKLRLLCKKVTADFLQNTRQIINVELTRIPVTMTYAQALTSFRNEVNQKFPPQMTTQQRYRRNISSTQGRGDRGQSGRGRGRGGRGRGRGRGGGRGNRRPQGVRYITATDGQTMEVHASYKFSAEDWERLPREEKNRIIEERKAYSAQKRQRRDEAQVSMISSVARSVISELRQAPNNTSDEVSALGEGTAAAPPRSIMGGRNEQAQLRGRNPNNSTQS